MRFWIMMLLTAFSLIPPCRVVAQGPGGDADEALHIGVQARYLDGSPMEGMRDKDFIVTAQGVRVGVASSQPWPPARGVPADLPVHVLLMISVYSDISSEAAITGLITRELPESFGTMRLAIFQSNGRVTEYAHNRTELIHQVQGFGNRRVSIPVALEELGQHPGRHALIYYTEKGVRIPPLIQRQAAAAAALVYQVGGSKDENYVQGGELPVGMPSLSQGDRFIYGPADDLHGGVGILAPPEVYAEVWTKSIRQKIVEHSLKGAFHDLSNDGLGYYDLTLTIPAATARLDLRLNARHDYQVSAQPYTLDQRVPPELHLPTRQ